MIQEVEDLWKLPEARISLKIYRTAYNNAANYFDKINRFDNHVVAYSQYR